MNYQTLQKKERQFLSVSGLSHRDFVALHTDFARTWQTMMSERTIDGKPRRRKRSIRSDSVLKTTEDTLLFILSYLKNNPTQEYHASQWGMRQSQAHPYIRCVLDALHQTLMRSDSLPSRTNLELMERLEAMTVQERHSLGLDGTERPIERPQDSALQKKRYSGKKKRHTMKNLLINGGDRCVLFLSRTFDGSVHDKRCADEVDFIMPDETRMLQDTGFQGLHIEGVETVQPTKKPKGKELTAEQKQENRDISRERITIEHSIGGVKIFRMVKDTIRVRSYQLRDKIMEICTGLFNFKTKRRIAPY